MTNLMIVEDDKNISSSYQNYLAKEKELSIIAKAYDGLEALKYYKERNPDIVLLDLGLPGINGIEVIERLSSYESNDKKCNIIVVSGDAYLKGNLLNTKKVYRIIQKPARLQEIHKSIKDFISENTKAEFPIVKLNDLLLECGLNVYSNSCIHLIDVINYCFYNKFKLKNINDVYAIVARDYNSTPDTLRSSIRSSIRTVYKNADKELLNSVFFIRGKKFNRILTPINFIECIIDYLNKNI